MPDLNDNKLLIPKHKNMLYIFCVTIRIFLGYFLLYRVDKNTPNSKELNKKFKKIKIWLCTILMTAVIFIKYYKSPQITWKSYDRTILNLFLTTGFLCLDKFELASGLVMVDVLTSIEARHTKLLIETYGK
jgi:uncharacterized membrane protein